MDVQDSVKFLLVWVCDALDQQEETDEFGLSINVFVSLFTLEAIIHGLRALSQGHGVYFRRVFAVLLAALDVFVNIFSKEEIFYFLVDIRSWGGYW